MNGRAARVGLLAAVLGLSMTVANAGDPGSTTIIARVRVNGGVAIDLQIAKERLRQAQPFEVKATVTNRTGALLSKTLLTLHADVGRLVTNRDATREVPNLALGESGKVSWTACSDQPGAYVILATLKAVTSDGAEEAASSVAVVAEVAKQPTKRCPSGFR